MTISAEEERKSKEEEKVMREKFGQEIRQALNTLQEELELKCMAEDSVAWIEMAGKELKQTIQEANM